MGTLAESYSGFAFTTGEPDRPPTLPQFPIADGVAAMAGTSAVLAALYARQHNGGIGDEIDISLYEPLMALLGAMVINYDQLGTVSKRYGNRSNWTVPRNTYETKDKRWVAVSSAANSAAMRVFRAVGRDDMANDPNLATSPQRVARIDECDKAIAEWIAEHNLDEVLRRFEEFEVVADPVYDVAQIFADPHIKSRGTLVEMEDPIL